MPHLNEQGLTLIEVLLSIVILTIILVTFMNFFPQMTLMNNANEEKQDAINEAKEQLIEWQRIWEKDKNFEKFLNKPDGTIVPSGLQYINKENLSGEDYYVFKVNGENVELWIKSNADERPEKNTTLESKIVKKHNHAFIVRVLNENNNIISQTYGYITYEEEPEDGS